MQPLKLLNEAESLTFAKLIVKNFGKLLHVVSEKMSKLFKHLPFSHPLPFLYKFSAIMKEHCRMTSLIHLCKKKNSCFNSCLKYCLISNILDTLSHFNKSFLVDYCLFLILQFISFCIWKWLCRIHTYYCNFKNIEIYTHQLFHQF